MLRGVTIVDSDGVVRQQARLVHEYAPRFIATTPPAASYRYFMPYRDLPGLARQLATARDTVLFLGAGDFHHLTAAMLFAFRQDGHAGPGGAGHPLPASPASNGAGLALVLFDAHPDWSVAPPGYLHCGSWVPEVLTMPHVRAVALVGVGPLGSRGLLRPRMLQAVAPAVRAGRLRVYPVLSDTADELSAALPWTHRVVALEDGVEAVVEDLLEFIGEKPVYLSIDKDVVRPEELPGGWAGGLLDTDTFFRLVHGLLRGLGRRGLVAADVCGEYEPRLPLPQLDPALSMHEAFNMRLLEMLVPHPAARRPTGPRQVAA